MKSPSESRASLFTGRTSANSIFLACALGAAIPAQAQVDVWTFHNDNLRTGANLNETILTSSKVNYNSFGLVFTCAVQGQIYAQPLVLSNVQLPDQTLHNLVFVATQHNVVAAFEADGSRCVPIWYDDFTDPANGIDAVPADDLNGCSDIVPEVGVSATPVIDVNTRTLYVVTKTKQIRNGVNHYLQVLHALDAATGAERVEFASPVVLGDTVFPTEGHTSPSDPLSYGHDVGACVPGTGDGSIDGFVCFNALRSHMRSGLALAGGKLYLTWSSHCDRPLYQGWVMVYDAATLLPLDGGVFNTAPNGRFGGIWHGSAAPAVDAAGNLYLSTGNGTFAVDQAYGDTVIKFTGSPDRALNVADTFTPFNQASLSSTDRDLSSGGILVLPDQGGPYPHVLVTAGKESKIYLINRDDMGGYQRCGVTCDDVLATLAQPTLGETAGTAAYLSTGTEQFIYYLPGERSGVRDHLRRYLLTTDPPSLMQVAEGEVPAPPGFVRKGGFPSISAHLTEQGTVADAIVWLLQERSDSSGSSPAILRAYDALATPTMPELYNSTQAPDLRDTMGNGLKFNLPTVANGRVYAGTSTRLDVFGLLSGIVDPPDGPPSDLTAVSRFPSQVTLSWINHASNQTAVKIERSEEGTSFDEIARVARDVTTYTDNSVRSGTVYYYRVRATNQAGDSKYSNVAMVRTLVPAPVLTADTCVGQIGLAWVGAADDHYDIQRSANGTTFETIGSVSSTTLGFTDIPPASGTYAYRVEAFYTTGISSLSNPVTVTLGPVRIDHLNGFDRHDELQANGMAQFTPDGIARLAAAPNHLGSIFTTQRVGIRRFQTSFIFRLHDGTAPPTWADGLTFTIQGEQPDALAPGGGGLGYGADRTPESPGPGPTEKGIRNSVTIKFDLFNNVGEGPNSTGIFTDGNSPTLRSGGLTDDIPDRSVDLRPTPIDLHAVSDKLVILTYDGFTLAETIFDLSNPNLKFTTSYDLDISRFIGADTAFVGFTGASGGGSDWSFQDILSWTYEEQEDVDLSPRQPARLRVTGVSRSDGTHSNISLGWLCNAYTSISGFSIERSTDGVAYAEVGRVDLPSTRFTDQGLAGGAYYYRARAFNKAQSSQPSSLESILIGGGDNPTVVDHSQGFADHGDLTANGNGHYVGTFAELTQNPQHGASGSVFLNNRVSISNFSTSFTFRLTSAVADGITFAIQGNSPTAIGLRGSGMGYGLEDVGGPGRGIRNSAAITFKIYNSNATGIVTDGRTPNRRPDGLSPDVPDRSVDLIGSGIDLHTGHVLRVDVTYGTGSMMVTITDTETSASATQNYPIDLPRFLGGNFGYLGFTGGTGGLSATQDILTWTFQAP